LQELYHPLFGNEVQAAREQRQTNINARLRITTSYNCWVTFDNI
jgi:hypothetical protein